jgi:type I restriction enzyme S subunit
VSDELPEGWAQAMLGDVITGFEAGRNLRAEGRPASNGENGVLKISAVTWGTFRPEENKALLPGDEPRPHETIRKGDLLITRANTSDLVGAVVIVDRDYPHLMLPDKILRLRVKDGVERSFILHGLRLREVRDYFAHNATGTSDSMRNLSQPKIEAAPLRLAPLPEQRRLIAQVEALLADVEKAKERLDRVPLILKRFRQAVLAVACSGDLTKDWRERTDLAAVVAPPKEVGDDGQENTESFLPELPQTWAWAALDDACENVIDYRGRTPPTSDRGRIPHVRTTNVRRGKIDWNTESFVSEDIYAEYMTRGIPKVGDVIFTMEAPMGDAGVVDTERKFSLAQRLLLLRGKRTLLEGAFLAHVLQAAPVRRAIEHRATGTTVLGIAYKRFKYVQLPIPPLAEQREIVRRVDALFTLSDTIELRVQAATARADKLAHAILSKAFSGELVPTEAELARAEGRTYETAELLLEGLRRNRSEPDAKPKKMQRDAKMPKAKATSLKETILHMPRAEFSFEELRKHAPGDYGATRDALFALLAEKTPIIKQLFDPTERAIRFVRVDG